MPVSSKVVTVKAAVRFLSILGISSWLAGAPTFAAVSPDLVQPKVSDTKSSIKPEEWTYLVLWAATHPSPFEGSDARSNLVYDLVMTNFNAQPGVLKEIEITDGETGRLLLSLSGKSLQAVVTKIGDNGLRFAPCECALLWINLSFDKKSELARKLKHHVVFDSVDQDNNPKTYSYTSTINVEAIEPVVVGPPLKGGRWMALGGYSGNSGHRRALFPLSNHLYAAQTYAIDWIKLDNENNQIVGDRTKVENTIGYGQPVLAVNDATVVGVIDRFEDQPMDKAVGPERLQFPTGNTVILDLGHGYYATYAHLKRGVNIQVAEGRGIRASAMTLEVVADC